MAASTVSIFWQDEYSWLSPAVTLSPEIYSYLKVVDRFRPIPVAEQPMPIYTAIELFTDYYRYVGYRPKVVFDACWEVTKAATHYLNLWKTNIHLQNQLYDTASEISHVRQFWKTLFSINVCLDPDCERCTKMVSYSFDSYHVYLSFRSTRRETIAWSEFHRNELCHHMVDKIKDLSDGKGPQGSEQLPPCWTQQHSPSEYHSQSSIDIIAVPE